MKWENDVASGEELGWRQSLIFLRYPFLPFGHAVLTHLFSIPVLQGDSGGLGVGLG